jgi:hypothetical protein
MMHAATGEDDHAAHQAFKDWFSEKGGISNTLDLQVYPNMGRGVAATQDIAEGSTLLKVPIEMTISEDAVAKHAASDTIYQSLQEELYDSKSDVIATAALLIEKAREETSIYAPYLKLLPVSIPSLVTFSPDELAELHDAKLSQEVTIEQKNMREKYETLYRALSAFLPSDLLSFITYENYIWADLIVDSRALRFQGRAYLIPYADMLNYCPHPNKREAQQGAFYLAHHKLTDTDVSILADRYCTQ